MLKNHFFNQGRYNINNKMLFLHPLFLRLKINARIQLTHYKPYY